MNLSTITDIEITPGVTDAATGCFPTPKTYTGTITSSGIYATLTGAGAILTENMVNKYLFNGGVGGLFQTRRIVNVNIPNNIITLDAAFTNPVNVATNLQIANPSFRAVMINNNGAGNAIINSKSLPAATIEQRGDLAKRDAVAPFGYDFSATTGIINGQN